MKLAECRLEDPRLAEDLARCASDLPARLAGWLRDGTALPLAIETRDGQRVGSLVLGRERDADGSRWLIVHALAADSAPGRDVTAWALATVREIARRAGYAGARAWTRRRGLVRRLERAGARISYVMEMPA